MNDTPAQDATTTGPEVLEEPTRRSPRTFIRAALDHPLFTYRLVIVTGAMLLVLGLLMVISSSSVIAAVDEQDPYYYGKRQLVYAAVGLAGAVALCLIPVDWLRRLAWPALGLSLVLMVATFTPLGVDSGGNRNWLRLGSQWLQFQPSEFAKLALILWGANDLARRRRQLTDLRQWLVYIVVAFVTVGLVVMQKDLGTAVVMGVMVLVVLIAAGAPWRLLGGLTALSVIGVVGLILVQPFRLRRIWAFLNPTEDPLGLNRQAERGIYALASGGWFGQGLGASRQKWGLLAGAHTDYIFAVVGEELGLLGTLTLIALFVVLAFAGLRIASRSTSMFSQLLCVGVVAWFTVQAFINIAVATRAFPVMGVTLPFVSYGGSSLMANLFALGLLAGCARREPAATQLLAARSRPSRTRTIVRAEG
ncbi:MAG: putative lipid II flippase FtsW [Propionibacteriaceae bacterium]|jgi:cell division protein FtsW|nr:putative lipid II flippase FtsW [Propionibacteriaceae bacterium]